ncbi:MAG: carboxypeptidase regulatory-like domain-containing protein [Sedimentisphaerales bacterium]|nr:carboxypeptidase regulatory-like domain-containing protein [Sedimentisphaerales bacterium]
MTEAGKTISKVKIEVMKGGIFEAVITDAITGKPIEKAGISIINEEDTQYRYKLSNKGGVIRMRLMPDEYALFDGVYKQGYSTAAIESRIIIENGKTEHFDYALFPDLKITGVVRDEKGNPLQGATLIVWPSENQTEAVTNAEGHFEVTYGLPNLSGGDKPDLLLLCRYEERNLACAVDVSEGTRTVDVRLKPGVMFYGKVTDTNGNGIMGAKLYVQLRKDWIWSIAQRQPTTRAQATTDEEGKFEIKAIPLGHEYNLLIQAKGYGNRRSEQINTEDAVDDTLDLGNITLAEANLSVSGVVVDDKGKPVADAVVNNSSINQPFRHTKTDANGRFTLEEVCAGNIIIFAVKDGETRLRGSVATEGGMTHIRLVVSEKSSPPRLKPKQPRSFKGKSLPQLKEVGIDLLQINADNKMILVCFFDLNQRPSRRCINQLTEQTAELNDKGVMLLVIETSKVDQETLDRWVKKNDISFPVGMIQGEEEKTCFTWGVKSLPWLILTDKNHVVVAEGFALNEMDNKIAQIAGQK